MLHADQTIPNDARGKPIGRVVLGRPNALQRLNQRFATHRPVAWCLARTLHHLDKVVLRMSGGRRTAAEVLTGLPVIALTTTGARSGQPRTMPLIGIPGGERIAVVGTNVGQRHHPAWYHNVRANPEVIVAYRGQRAAYLASDATEADRDRLWHEATRVYVGYAVYLGRIGDRHVPIVILTPRYG